MWASHVTGYFLHFFLFAVSVLEPSLTSDERTGSWGMGWGGALEAQETAAQCAEHLHMCACAWGLRDVHVNIGHIATQEFPCRRICAPADTVTTTTIVLSRSDFSWTSPICMQGSKGGSGHFTRLLPHPLSWELEAVVDPGFR